MLGKPTACSRAETRRAQLIPKDVDKKRREVGREEEGRNIM